MKKIFTSSIILVFFSCSEYKKSESNDNSSADLAFTIEQVNWFLGTWQNKTLDGTFTESWERTNDSLFEAISTVINGKDTLFYEKINLQKTERNWNYVVSVQPQSSSASVIKNEQPVAFKLKSFSSTNVVFENTQHDFPTKIIYTQINKDSIVAEISGIVNGEKKKELFPMTRIK